MRELARISLAAAAASLLALSLCQVAVATSPGGTLLFSSAYGGDPGRDETMFTPDDLNYMHVLTQVAGSKIAVLTVDCQPGTTSPYEIDAHNNFDYIANQTGGVHYYSTTTWQTIRDEIQVRIGTGKGDVIFIFDLTGSMSGALSTWKPNAKNIIDGLAGDIAFGVGSHVDYNGSYNSYGYAAIYGDALYGDYDWSLDQDITTNSTTAKTAIDNLGQYVGGDGPQNYARALYESQFYSWRHKATRIVVMFGDAPAHAAPSGLAKGTGGGWIASSKKTFHFNVKMKPLGPKGTLRYTDQGTGMTVDKVSIGSLSFYRTATGAGALIQGTCEVNGVGGYSFSATAEDNGEPGKGLDTFSISIPSLPYSYGGLLQGGNIQIHVP